MSKLSEVILKVREEIAKKRLVILLCDDVDERVLLRTVFSERRCWSGDTQCSQQFKILMCQSLAEAKELGCQILFVTALTESLSCGDPEHFTIVSTFDMPEFSLTDQVKYPRWWGDSPRKNALWTSEEDKHLRYEVHYHMDIALIAKRHGREPGGVTNRIAQLFGSEFTYKKPNHNHVRTDGYHYHNGLRYQNRV